MVKMVVITVAITILLVVAWMTVFFQQSHRYRYLLKWATLYEKGMWGKDISKIPKLLYAGAITSGCFIDNGMNLKRS